MAGAPSLPQIKGLCGGMGGAHSLSSDVALRGDRAGAGVWSELHLWIILDWENPCNKYITRGMQQIIGKRSDEALTFSRMFCTLYVQYLLATSLKRLGRPSATFMLLDCA